MREEFRRIGGEAAVEGLALASQRVPNALKMSVAERARRRVGQEAFWSSPCENVLDRATAMMPRLMYQRLDDLGIDFSVVYPTAGLSYHRMQDTRMRRAICRAYNIFAADQFRGLEDRVIPAAIIPMYTPRGGDRGDRVRGHPARLQGHHGRRDDAAAGARARRGAAGGGEPRRVVRRHRHRQPPRLRPGVAEVPRAQARAHLPQRGPLDPPAQLPSNFCYNHIGHFASAGHAVAKALFFGGVTRRFPDLNFAFLEGGVGWACMLYADLIGHWEKRNGQAIQSTHPSKLDRGKLLELAQKYGRPEVVEAVRRGEGLEGDSNSALTGGVEDVDDYFRCQIERKQDIRDLFVPRFYFGCEADDPANAWAFNTKANPMRARLNAIFSSDIGHFDVPDMTEVVPEAYELVEHGLLDDNDFRDFMFGNAVRFWGEVNPDFFRGTTVEKAAAQVLAAPAAR
jgi:hypothetical protein